jgi:hypothetical protein
MAGLVHVVCAGLLPDLEAGALVTARSLALDLVEAPPAVAVVVGESPTHLLVATWLESRDALEAFAASPAHMAFIMRGVARVTSGMWSAAAETAAPPPLEAALAEADAAQTMFVFGLRASEGPQLYEWEVRALLDGVAGLPGIAAVGPTFEERDRFRAAGVVVIQANRLDAFNEALATTAAGWGGAARALEHATAPVGGMRQSARPSA